MTNDSSGKRPKGDIAQLGYTKSANEEAGIAILEAIYDAVALRQGFRKEPVSVEQFDFFGAMVRAKRIFETREK
jgi:hypothetical protein